MKFNYHAVSKKDRIIKTIILGTPATILIGFIGALAIIFANKIGISFLYYAVILGIGYFVGTMVRKVGRGLTTEFLIIAIIFDVLAILLAMYLSLALQLGFMPLDFFFTNFFGFINGHFSLIEIFFSLFVASSQALVGSN